MKQTLKISIARGGCRFATPLYLGGCYELSFAGERADEADCVLFTKPRSRTPNKEVGIDALAISVRELPNENPVLNLNKQVLLDWFKDCGCCEVDATVDAHCYVFNASGEVIADSDVCIEYMPVDFVIDAEGFAKWDELRIRIVALEEQAREAQAKFDAQVAKNESLDKTDAQNLIAATNDATRKSNETLDAAKSYADAIMNMVAKIQYVKCDAESTEEKQVYHRVLITKNAHGEHTLAINETPVSIEGGDPETTRYVYTDTNQQISGNKTFTGNTNVKTASVDSNDTTAASTAWVGAKLLVEFTSFLNRLLSTNNTWTAKQIFSGGLKGNLAGDVTGNVTGDVTGNLTGDVKGNVDATTLDVTGAETHGGVETHAGEETHNGNEVHNGSVEIINSVAPAVASDPDSIASTHGINVAYAWAMLGKYCKYYGGLFRILDTNLIQFALNGGVAHDSDINSTAWREHDRQTGIFSWLCTVLELGSLQGSDNLNKIVFPNVTEVKDRAFKYSHELYSAVLSSCKKIGEYSFACTKSDGRGALELRAIYAPNVEEIGAHAFERNQVLHNINEDEEATDFGDTKLLGTVKFPKCVSVGDYAFYNTGIYYYNRPYYLLRYVDLPVARYIGQYAFYDDANYGARPYKEVKIGNKMEGGQYVVPLGSVDGEIDTRNIIGQYAFYGQSDAVNGPLTKIDCPRTQVFGAYCFYDCKYVTSDLNIESAEEIGDFAFTFIGSAYSNAQTFPQVGINIPNCKNVGRCGLGNGEDANSYYTFRWIDAPSLETVAYTGFMNQGNVTKVNMPSLRHIGQSAFNRCYSLCKSFDENGDKDFLEFPSCTEVGTNAFYNCTGLATLKMNNAATIGSDAFYGCSSLTNLHLENVTTDKILSQISSWSLNGNCRVHASGGSTIAYVNNAWQVI